MNTILQETPLREIGGIYFKLEDKNPSGSVKDRGVSCQIERALQTGCKKFVVSSSGNAAISADYWCNKNGVELSVFVSPSVAKGKLAKLKSGHSKVIIDRRPISSAIRYAKEHNAYNLRASTDPYGSVGYESLAVELQKQIGEVGSLFIPVSSGTLCYGVSVGFEKIGRLPQINAVQTTSCNLIASSFDKDFKSTDKSIADALVARTSLLKSKLIEIIKKSGGSGWIIADTEIMKYWRYLKKNGVITSYEGAATLAGVIKAQNKSFALEKPIVCLLTGKYYN